MMQSHKFLRKYKFTFLFKWYILSSECGAAAVYAGAVDNYRIKVV